MHYADYNITRTRRSVAQRCAVDIVNTLPIALIKFNVNGERRSEMGINIGGMDVIVRTMIKLAM